MMSTVYTFIAVAPYVAIEIYGVSPPEYGLWFAVPAAASFVGFMLAGRISRAKGNYWMMRAGASVSLAGAVAILACVAAGLWSPAALFLPAMLICHANALSAPNSTAAAIMVRPDIAGAASGLLGFLQLAIAAAFAQTVAMLEDGTPWPPALAILAANALALASYQWIRRHRDARIAAAHDATVAAEATRESST
jgi:DHA1 family bicyclomycin/chloramphenicol resistance-like MFS transporter